MDKIPPYFHFYPNDYWTDEKASLLTYEQHGVYIFLLSRQWIEGSIPPDLPTLATLCKLDGDVMASLWRGLSPCFKLCKGRLINPRLNRERQKLIAYFKSHSDSGKLGASALWANKLKRRATLKQRYSDVDGDALATITITKAIAKTKEVEKGKTLVPNAETSEPTLDPKLLEILKDCPHLSLISTGESSNFWDSVIASCEPLLGKGTPSWLNMKIRGWNQWFDSNKSKRSRDRKFLESRLTKWLTKDLEILARSK